MNDIQRKELEIMVEIDRILRKEKLEYFLAYGTVLGALRHKGFIPWDSDIDIVVSYDSLESVIVALENNLKPEFKVFHNKMKNEKYDSLKPRVGLKNSTHHDLHVDIFPLIKVDSYNEAVKLNKKFDFLYKVYFLKNFQPLKYHNFKPFKLFKHLIVKFFLIGISNKYIEGFYRDFEKASSTKGEYHLNICGSYKLKEIIPGSFYGNPIEALFEGNKFFIPENSEEYLKHLYGEDYMTPKKY